MASTVRISQATTLLVCGAGLLCACGLGGGGYKPPGPPPAVPETAISATELYFKATAGQAAAVQRVTLTNLGSEPLRIVQQELTDFHGKTFAFESTCANSLGPSASCVVSVTFRPSSDLKQGRYGGAITLDMANYERHRVYLSGTVLPPESPGPLAPK